MPSLSAGLWSVTLDGYLHWSVLFVKLGPPPFCGSAMVLQNFSKGVGFITFSDFSHSVGVGSASHGFAPLFLEDL